MGEEATGGEEAERTGARREGVRWVRGGWRTAEQVRCEGPPVSYYSANTCYWKQRRFYIYIYIILHNTVLKLHNGRIPLSMLSPNTDLLAVRYMNRTTPSSFQRRSLHTILVNSWRFYCRYG